MEGEGAYHALREDEGGPRPLALRDRTETRSPLDRAAWEVVEEGPDRAVFRHAARDGLEFRKTVVLPEGAYAAEVLSKLVLKDPKVTLKPGVELEDVRRAFEKLDPEYRAFQAMAPGG